MPDLIGLVLIVGLAFTVEAAAGFGATLIAVTLAAQRMPVAQVLAVFVPVNVLLSAFLVVRYRHSVDRPLLVGSILPWMGVGFLGGLGLFRLGSPTWLKGAFGVFVVVLSLVELLRRGSPAPLSIGARRGVLVAAGLVHGLFATGGPLVVWVVGREAGDKTRFRATLGAVWLCFGVGLVISYLVAGTVNATTLGTSAVLLLPLVGGLVLGEWLHHRVPPAPFRTGVFVLLLGAGLVLVRGALVG